MQIKHKAGMLGILFCLMCFLPLRVSAADKEKEREYDFNENKTVTVSDKRSYAATEKYTWLKYKPAADGYLTITVSDAQGAEEAAKGYIALYNSKKTGLLSSNAIFYNTTHSKNRFWYQFTFGMLKGQEYYIRIKAENAAEFSRAFTKVKDVSGISRIKAKNLKKNKARMGLIPAGVSNTDWYQINLTQKQKIRLYYNAKTSGSFKLSVYMGTRLIGRKNIYYTSGQRKLTLCQRKGSSTKKSGMNAGKYYIKIERANTTSSGYYKIKWN